MLEVKSQERVGLHPQIYDCIAEFRKVEIK